MSASSSRARMTLLAVACVAGLAVVAAVDTSSSSRPAQDNFLDQLARSAQALGSALETFIKSLGNRGNTRSGNADNSIIPLVAIDTRKGPTIDIPGILGLNTGASTRGSSPVSVNTRQGSKLSPSTQVNIPGILDLDVGGDSPKPADESSLVSVLTGGGQSRVRAPFVDVSNSKAKVFVRAQPSGNAGAQSSGNVPSNEEQILS